MTDPLVLIDTPAPHVRRLTLNRPEKRNALNHPLRGQLIDALQAADLDDDVHVLDHPGRRHVLLGRLRPRRAATRATSTRTSPRPARASGRATSPRRGWASGTCRSR